MASIIIICPQSALGHQVGVTGSLQASSEQSGQRTCSVNSVTFPALSFEELQLPQFTGKFARGKCSRVPAALVLTFWFDWREEGLSNQQLLEWDSGVTPVGTAMGCLKSPVI